MSYNVDDATTVEGHIPLIPRKHKGVGSLAWKLLLRPMRKVYLKAVHSTRGTDELRRATAQLLRIEYHLSDAWAKEVAKKLIWEAPVEVRENLAEWLGQAVTNMELVTKRLNQAVEENSDTQNMVHRLNKIIDEEEARILEEQGKEFDVETLQDRVKKRLQAETKLGGVGEIEVNYQKKDGAEEEVKDRKKSGQAR